VTDQPTAIEELARLWLAAEREASRQGNSAGTEKRARQASAAYEVAVTSASREDLLVAWHAALAVQHAQEMGSVSWSQAREVSELLRVEYLASEVPGASST
jgi:hypothetical protein